MSRDINETNFFGLTKKEERELKEELSDLYHSFSVKPVVSTPEDVFFENHKYLVMITVSVVVSSFLLYQRNVSIMESRRLL